MPTTGIFDDDEDDEEDISDDLGMGMGVGIGQRQLQPGGGVSSVRSCFAAACPSARFCSQLLLGPLAVGLVWLAWSSLIHSAFSVSQQQVLRGFVRQAEVSQHPLFTASTDTSSPTAHEPSGSRAGAGAVLGGREGDRGNGEHEGGGKPARESGHHHRDGEQRQGEERNDEQEGELKQHEQDHEGDGRGDGGGEGDSDADADQAETLGQMLENEAAASIAQGGDGAILVRILSVLQVDCPPPCQIYAAAILQQKSRRTEVLQRKSAKGSTDFTWKHPVPFLFGVPKPAKPGTTHHFVLEVWKQGLFKDEKITSLVIPIDALTHKVDEVQTLEMRAGSMEVQIAYASASTSPTLANHASAASDAAASLELAHNTQKAGCKIRAKRVEFCQTNVTDFHSPRYSLTNASQLLWSGDDDIQTTARLSFYTPPRERDRKGVVIQAGKADPACDRICNTSGCWRLGAEAVGRLGNRMTELMHAVYFLDRTNSRPGLNIRPGFVPLVFEFPEHLCVGGPERWQQPAMTPEKALGCSPKPPEKLVGHEYEPLCKFAKNSDYQPLARSFFLPYLSPTMKQCLAKPRDLDEDRLLTIHLRGEDVFGVHIRTKDYEKENFWGISVLDRIRLQPPCVFFEKIITDSDFGRVLLVTSQDLANPCVAWLNERRQTIRNQRGELLMWELQTGTLEEDACALLKARHIAPSQSSLAHSLVAVAAAIEPRTVYLAGRPFDKNWILHCDSANVTWVAYDVPYYNPKAMGDLMDPVTKLRVPSNVNATLEWLVNLPAWSLNRTTCEQIDRQHR